MARCWFIQAATRLFSGPEIVQAPLSEQQRHVWSTQRVLDSLPPDVRAVTDADVRRVQEEARALVRAHALQRTRAVALSARGISDFVRVDRVEGLAGPGVGEPSAEHELVAIGHGEQSSSGYGLGKYSLGIRADSIVPALRPTLPPGFRETPASHTVAACAARLLQLSRALSSLAFG